MCPFRALVLFLLSLTVALGAWFTLSSSPDFKEEEEEEEESPSFLYSFFFGWIPFHISSKSWHEVGYKTMFFLFLLAFHCDILLGLGYTQWCFSEGLYRMHSLLLTPAQTVAA